MKKILILANNDVGLYNFRKELIEELLQQGYEVNISLPYGDRVEDLKRLGCIFMDTPINRRGTNLIDELKLLFRYYNLLKSLKPDVVLTYTIKPNIYGSIVCRALKIPYINNITGLGTGFLKKILLTRLLVMMYKVALKDSQMVFFQNENDMNYILNLKIIKGKYKLIPGSGVNLEMFQHLPYPPEGKFIFNFIGRIMKEKGIEEYLIAAKTIKLRNHDVQFNIIGFIEPTQNHYQDVLADYEADNYITYYGFQKEVSDFVESSHCLIQPSHSEGLSNVLLEAAAMGRVLIASDIPGCKEVVDNNGYLFRVRDANNLVDKIEKFIRLPYEQKVQMGRMSRQKVEQEFDRKIVVDSYMQVIKTID